jgi:endonuclease/exonuclease/phosphatase family metal-dependent hydrolase
MLAAVTMITLNFWGLPPVGTLSLSLLKEERAAALCSELQAMAKAQTADVVALQEVWEPRDRQALAKCGFPVAVDLDDPARLIDSGLLILSRHPLAPGTEPRRVRFEAPDAGPGLAFDGESTAEKSVLIARFRRMDGTTFVIGNTHLVSRYTRAPEYARHAKLRERSFVTAVQAVREHRQDAQEPAFLLGDFNTGPWLDGIANPRWPELTRDVDYDRSQDRVCTVCATNPFQDGMDERMDFVFSLPSARVERVREARVWDQERELAPGLRAFLSDHFGWSATYRF